MLPLNTEHYRVQIKGKVEQSKERSSAPPPLDLGVVAIEKRAFGSPLATVTNILYPAFVSAYCTFFFFFYDL